MRPSLVESVRLLGIDARQRGCVVPTQVEPLPRCHAGSVGAKGHELRPAAHDAQPLTSLVLAGLAGSRRASSAASAATTPPTPTRTQRRTSGCADSRVSAHPHDGASRSARRNGRSRPSEAPSPDRGTAARLEGTPRLRRTRTEPDAAGRAAAAVPAEGRRHETTRMDADHVVVESVTNLWFFRHYYENAYSHFEQRPCLLERQRRVLRQHLGDGTCYLHGSDSGRWALHRPVYGQRRPRATMNAASHRRGSSGRGPFNRQPKPKTTCLVGLRRSLVSDSLQLYRGRKERNVVQKTQGYLDPRSLSRTGWCGPQKERALLAGPAAESS